MAPPAHRLESIDRLRGLVMILMALDHVRDMCARPRPELLDFADADPALFFTRWITHFCAPAFIFLAGASAYFYVRKYGDSTRFLVTRGIWLILLELTVLRLAWTFNTESFFMAGVIWVI